MSDTKINCGCLIGVRRITVEHCGGHSISEPSVVLSSGISAERHQELLQCIADMSRDSISPADAEELRGQLAVLVAEIGTLRAQLRATNMRLPK